MPPLDLRATGPLLLLLLAGCGAPGEHGMGAVVDGRAAPRSASPLAEPDQVLVGEEAGVAFGAALAGVGDVDGDGYGDLLVAGPGAGDGAGAAWWYRGTRDGVEATPAGRWDGDAAGDALGTAVAGVGDVDGDGRPDLALGAPGALGGRGALWLLRGADGGPGASPDAEREGPEGALGFASVLAGVGDSDGDGDADLAVGAPDAAEGAGRVWWYGGAAGGLERSAGLDAVGDRGGDALGSALAGADLDGDGRDDLLAGAPGTRDGAGAVWRWAGAAGGPSPSGDHFASDLGGRFGAALVGLGDLDGDGYGDAAFGAPDVGEVIVQAGSAAGANPADRASLGGTGGFGAALAAADHDGDGLPDLLVGAPDAGDGAGELALYLGRRRGYDASTSATRTGEGGGYGSVVVAVGDLNADGYADFAVARPDADTVELHLGHRDEDGDGVDARVDCDDADPAVYPGAPEVVGNGLDDDCDGYEACYVDADGDGWRAGEATVASEDAWCGAPGEAGAFTPDGDCDDADAGVNPDIRELPGDGVDEDCDGGEICYVDEDGDGFRPSPGATVGSADAACDGPGEAGEADEVGDCDDADGAVHPGAAEAVGDGLDQDCDGYELCWPDADEDGYRPDGEDTVVSRDGACGGRGEAGADEPAGDCDDLDPRYHPGADEPDCTDPADYDCDGRTAWADDDGDTWAACEDCDDTDPERHPSADELCDEVDQDCDGTADEGAVDAPWWYPDADGDGYTLPTGRVRACEAPEGYAAASDQADCDDVHDGTYPGAEDPPRDAIDQDCDGTDDPLPPDTGGPAPPTGCGCATGGEVPGGAGLAGLLLLAAGLGARRRGPARAEGARRTAGGEPTNG